jgi:hypothetical protein
MGGFAKDDPVAKGPVTRCLDQLSVRPDARERFLALKADILAIRDQSYRGLERVFAPAFSPTSTTPARSSKSPDTWRPTGSVKRQGGGRPSSQSLRSMPSAFCKPWRCPCRAEALRVPSIPTGSWAMSSGAHQSRDSEAGHVAHCHPCPTGAGVGGIMSESSEAWVTLRRAGLTSNEIDPTSGGPGPGDTNLRVRTFKIQSRPPR